MFASTPLYLHACCPHGGLRSRRPAVFPARSGGSMALCSVRVSSGAVVHGVSLALLVTRLQGRSASQFLWGSHVLCLGS